MAALGNSHVRGQLDKWLKAGRLTTLWPPPLCLCIGCFQGLRAPFPQSSHVEVWFQCHLLPEASFQSPHWKGLHLLPSQSTLCKPLSGLLVYLCCFQNPAIIRLVSVLCSESHTENVSFDCIHVPPDSSGLRQGTPVTIQGTMILHRAEAWIWASWVSKPSLLLPGSGKQTLHISEPYLGHL